ncbi:MAG: hypothetical protein AAF825_01715 [Pseudomonadota bacterium]
MSFVPESYEDWKHCITVKCDIPLTAQYIDDRIAALTDDSDFNTQRFIERWGAKHHARTVEWFKRAKEELAASA